MWPTVVTAASPAVKRRGFRSTGTPLASTSRALAPAIRTTAGPRLPAPARRGSAGPGRAGGGVGSILPTPSSSLRIDEARRTDLDFAFFVAPGVDSAPAPADPFRPAGQQSQANPMPQRR